MGSRRFMGSKAASHLGKTHFEVSHILPRSHRGAGRQDVLDERVWFIFRVPKKKGTRNPVVPCESLMRKHFGFFWGGVTTFSRCELALCRTTSLKCSSNARCRETKLWRYTDSPRILLVPSCCLQMLVISQCLLILDAFSWVHHHGSMW